MCVGGVVVGAIVEKLLWIIAIRFNKCVVSME
jgi:hypothetical protein